MLHARDQKYGERSLEEVLKINVVASRYTRVVHEHPMDALVDQSMLRPHWRSKTADTAISRSPSCIAFGVISSVIAPLDLVIRARRVWL